MKTGITATAAAILLIVACGDVTEIIPPVLPHDPVNEGWKVVQNYEYGFNTKDLTLIGETLDPLFEYFLSEEDWDDYDGDGIVDTSLPKELFLEVISQLFGEMEVIELALTGNQENPWSGDPTGQTIQYIRNFNMKAYNWVGGQQEGWTRLGSVSLLAKPDTAGTWRITQIVDITDQ